MAKSIQNLVPVSSSIPLSSMQNDLSDIAQLVALAKMGANLPQGVMKLFASHIGAAFDHWEATGREQGLGHSLATTNTLMRWALASDKVSGVVARLESAVRSGFVTPAMIRDLAQNPKMIADFLSGS